MATKLILIRHGVTEWNLKNRYAGFTDVELSSEGKRQVAKLRPRFKKLTVHKVYSSNKKRALQSARIVFKRTKIELLADLREIHFGIFEGLTYEEIMAKYPAIYKKWFKDPFATAIPKAERLGDFRKRVVRAFRNIISLNKDKTVAVVCHGGSISIYLNHILKSRDFWQRIPGAASLSIVEHKGRRAEIKLFNDSSHLD